MQKGFIYLTAIIDWYSRYVLDWEISVTMESEFCCATLSRVLMRTTPEIFNTDQGSQYTSKAFTGLHKLRTIKLRILAKIATYSCHDCRATSKGSSEIVRRNKMLRREPPAPSGVAQPDVRRW